MAGCNALNTSFCEVALGTHLNGVTWCITLSRHDVMYLGTPTGLTSFAKPNASIGDCEAGVPVIIQRRVEGAMSFAKVFQRFVVTVLYAFASSITIRSNPTLPISSETVPTPSKLMMTNSYSPLMTFLRLFASPYATPTVRCIDVLKMSACHAEYMIDRGQMTSTRLTSPWFIR